MYWTRILIPLNSLMLAVFSFFISNCNGEFGSYLDLLYNIRDLIKHAWFSAGWKVVFVVCTLIYPKKTLSELSIRTNSSCPCFLAVCDQNSQASHKLYHHVSHLVSQIYSKIKKKITYVNVSC